jgi:hypothetical protein
VTRKTIIVVEDDADFSSYLEAVLADLGYVVRQLVITGEDAIARARATNLTLSS